MNGIDGAFRAAAAEGRAAVIPYLMAGYPDATETPNLLKAVAAAGADIIELGVPFSDPIADGPVIRQAALESIANGTTLRCVLAMLRTMRDGGFRTPVVLMGYANPFLSYGIEALARDARGIVEGLIVPDLPAEEAASWRMPLSRNRIHLIGFAAPTTTRHRLIANTASSSGFLYCIALKGVTGKRISVSASLPEELKRYRSTTPLPLAVGFGLSSVEQVREVATMADGLIVGSALIEVIRDAGTGAAKAAGDFVATLVNAARGSRPPQMIVVPPC